MRARALYAATLLLLMAMDPAVPAVVAEAVGSPSSILKKGKWVMGAGGGGFPARSLQGGAEASGFYGEHYRGYGLTDWLSLYGRLGFAYLEVDDASIQKANDPSTTNQFGLNVRSGIQLKGKLFESRRHRWEWDGSIQYVDLRARRKSKNEARWQEWQFATSVAKAFGSFTPYLGVKYTILTMKFRVRQDGRPLRQGRYEEDTPVGFFVGTDYAFGKEEEFLFNVESGYSDGADVNLSIAYRF